MKTIAVIPARMGATRLPGKPLIEVKSKPIIQYVWENTVSPLIDFKIIATDDERIFQAAKHFGAEAMMTDPRHTNGSERCAEVVDAHPDYDLVLNIQGDEPMVNTEVIRGLLEPFKKCPEIKITTLKTPIPSQFKHEVKNPNLVKVVTDHRGYALYFSRSPIPYNQDNAPVTYYKHVGFYAFQRECLLEYVKMLPSSLESIEKLEQLRLVEAGWPIYVSEFQGELIDINTEEDLKKFTTRLG